MKTKLTLLIAIVVSSIAVAQTNYTTTLPNNQEARNLYGNICCTYKINVATDAEGNAYVLSEQSADSSMWVTKYDYNGNLIYNTHVESGFTTDNRYFAKKIRVYDRVYVLCRMIGPSVGDQQTVFTLDKITGAVALAYATFVPAFGYASTELLDLAAAGNTVNMIGQVYDGSGNAKIEVLRTDLTWTGNIYVVGNNAGVNYLLNTESTCFSYYNGALYMTGQTSSGSGNNIFISKLDVWGFYSEYIYQNSAYTQGGKGLNVAAEGNAVYVSGALRAQSNKPFKTTVIKIDSSLTAPVWVNISSKSVWPLAINLSSTDVIYTVDFTLQVVGFSKATGNQLFAKNDFKSYAQVYNQPISTAVLNNNQLMIQASVGVKVMGNNSINKVAVKYSTSGAKVYQQLESLSNISPGNPGSAEALGLAYSAATNYVHQVYRKTTAAGQFTYVDGKASASSLRIAACEQLTADAIRIFPNPATDNATIACDDKIAEWTIYNTLSQSVASGNAEAEEIKIDCGSLEAGIYFISITTGSGETLTDKIIISRK